MADTQNLAVVVEDLNDRVKFTVDLIHTGAATDNVYSQAIPMYGLKGAGGAIHFKSLGVTTRDVNLFLQGGMNKTHAQYVSYITRGRWDDLSPDTTDSMLISAPEVIEDSFDINAELTTAVNQFIVVDPAFACEFIRFHSSGETGNLVTTSTIVSLILLKRPGFQEIPGGILPVNTA